MYSSLALLRFFVSVSERAAASRHGMAVRTAVSFGAVVDMQGQRARHDILFVDGIGDQLFGELRGFLRSAVQDLEVSTRLPGTLRFYRGCACTLPGLLSLVQHRASTLWHRLHGTRHRALQSLAAQHGVTLDAAFAAHPARFKGIAPRSPSVPLVVWINPPKKDTTPTTITPNCSLNS